MIIIIAMQLPMNRTPLVHGGKGTPEPIWRSYADYNDIHAVVDEQNVTYGFSNPAPLISHMHDQLKKEYPQYKRVVMHLVTKVPRVHTYAKLHAKRDFHLYVADKPNMFKGHAHAMRGYDDLTALIIAADLYRTRNDVLIISRDKFRDIDQFTKIPPYIATRHDGKVFSQVQIVPKRYVSLVPLFKKLNSDYLTKKGKVSTFLERFIDIALKKHKNKWT